MKLDGTRIKAWLVLAAFVAAGVFLLLRTGWRQSVTALAAFAAALACIVAIFLIWGAARNGFAKLFPPPPLWQKPRSCSALFDAELFSTLQPRLDLIERDGRMALWQDRETLQMWRSISRDFEFTENEVFAPIASKQHWKD